jgi:hypothetical protein
MRLNLAETTIYSIGLGLFTLFLSPCLFAAEQALILSQSNVDLNSLSDEKIITVRYVTDPSGQKATGLGVKMFFDSSRLSIEYLKVEMLENLVGVTDSSDLFQEDLEDQDSDPSTDLVAIVAYLDLNGSWPNTSEMSSLFEFSVKPRDARLSGLSTINFLSTPGVGFISNANFLAVNVLFAADYDGDGLLDQVDQDDDNDGVLDVDDDLPFDPSESVDTDGDGIGNNKDIDDDGDGFDDLVESAKGTDPLDPTSCPECFSLDIDKNGQVAPLTDGLIIMRFLFGFSGTSLISDALGADAQRATAAEIDAYLSSSSLHLDVDGDGEIKPLTDGVLLIRYFFGFRGYSLIDDVVSNSAERRTAEDISAYISSMLPGEG